MCGSKIQELNGQTIKLNQLITGINNWICENNGKVIVPMYQRNYKWSRAKAVKLVSEFIDRYQEYINTNVSTDKSISLFTLYINGGEMQIVDGQQRFITLWLIFKAMHKEWEFVDFVFERDELLQNGTRKAFLLHLDQPDANDKLNSDKRRFYYNYQGIASELSRVQDKDAFVKYIKENIILLLHVTSDAPVAEFLNLNCNKTQFSACDIARARIITYEHRQKESDASEYAEYLGTSKYRDGVARLFEDLSDLMYDDDIYALVKLNYRVNPDNTNENRINLLFGNMLLDTSQSFLYGELNQDITIEGEEINYIKKLAFYRKILRELQDSFGRNIDEDKKDWTNKKIYEELCRERKGIRFFEMLDDFLDNESIAMDANALTRILHEKCSIDQIMYDKVIETELNGEDAYLINRYYESIASEGKCNTEYSEIKNFKRNKYRNDFFKMDQKDFEDIAQGAGKYLLFRYISEKQRSNCLMLKASGGEEDKDIIIKGSTEVHFGEIASVNDLLCNSKRQIVIPAIQRDYCMGSHLKRNGFLAYLKEAFEKNQEIVLSAITLCVVSSGNAKEKEQILIYDGQQRCLTVAIILKWLGAKEQTEIVFEKRSRLNCNWQKYFQMGELSVDSYSAKSIDMICKELESLRLNEAQKAEWLRYFKDRVKFDVVLLPNSLSTADQFFMDFNEGVQLAPYEIFKCKLNDRYSRLKGGDGYSAIKPEDKVWGSRLDNEWLTFFYNYNMTRQEQELATEELMEMRFIEFCCRMLYWEKWIASPDIPGRKAPCDIKCFAKEGQEMGDMDLLISELTEEDFNRIKDIMDRLITFVKHSNTQSCVVLDCAYGRQSGFTHYHPATYNKEYMMECFLGALKEDEPDYNDIIIWGILNDLGDACVKNLMRYWNQQRINNSRFAVLRPGYNGVWNHVCLPIPAYYIGYPIIQDLRKAIEQEMINNLAEKYNDVMKLLVQSRAGKATSYDDVEWGDCGLRFARCWSVIGNIQPVNVYYYRSMSDKPEMLANKKIVQAANCNYIILLDEAHKVCGVLTTANYGSSAFMKTVGDFIEATDAGNVYHCQVWRYGKVSYRENVDILK